MTLLFDPSLHVVHSIRVGDNSASSLPQAPTGRKVERVWTVVDESALAEKGPCFETARLELESRVWRVKSDGSLSFRSQGVEPGTPVRVVLDYETSLERAQRLGLSLFDPTVHVIHSITAGSHHHNVLPQAPVGRKIERVWTVLNEDLLKEGGPGQRATFPEDALHDWQLNKDGTLRFYSRIVEVDTEVKIVLDYETAAEMAERRKIPRFHPETGEPIGAKSEAVSLEGDSPKARAPRIR